MKDKRRMKLAGGLMPASREARTSSFRLLTSAFRLGWYDDLRLLDDSCYRAIRVANRGLPHHGGAADVQGNGHPAQDRSLAGAEKIGFRLERAGAITRRQIGNGAG